jgi:hypothetical protein
MNEAFVYCWTDFGTNKLYVGVHKGTPDDGYVCSSKLMLQEYEARPWDFSRAIVASGIYPEMYVLETAILKAAGADKDLGYYNQTLNQGTFYLKRHTEESKRKMSMSSKGPNYKLREYKRTLTHCANITKSKKGKIPTCKIKKWEVVTPNGEVLQPYNLAQYARDNNLNRGHLAASGRCNTTHKGYRAVELV